MNQSDVVVRFLLDRFANRTDTFAVQVGRGACRASGDIEAALRSHLQGTPAQVTLHRTDGTTDEESGCWRVGFYTPGSDNLTKWLGIDFDAGPDHKSALVDAFDAAKRTQVVFAANGIASTLEKSKSGFGWHLWVFFTEPIPASKARALALALIPRVFKIIDGTTADPSKNRGVEVFPKRAEINSDGFGSMLYLPLYRGTQGGCSAFYTPSGEQVMGVPTVELVGPDAIEAVIAAIPVAVPPPAPPRPRQISHKFEDARLRFNADHLLNATKKAQPCPVPGCEGRNTFKGDALKATCFHSSHPDKCGTRVEGGCTVFDPLDLAAFTAGRTQREHLEHEGYLTKVETAPAPNAVFRPTLVRPEPPLLTDADVPPNIDDADDNDAAMEAGTVKDPEVSNVLRIKPPPPPPRSGRPTIQITTDEEVVNDAAVAALAADDRVYQRGHKLVTPLRGVKAINGVQRSSDALTITEVPLAKLREFMATAANWAKVDAASLAKRKAATGTANEKAAKADPIKWVPAHPPIWAIQAVLARGEWKGVRPLAGITEWPRLLADGTLLLEPGYDEKTGLYYEPMGALGHIPEIPTPDEVGLAVEALRDAVCDFPFATPSDFSVWLAGLLTPLALFSFDGPAPLFLAEATVKGSGKSLLWFLVGVLLQGRAMSGTPYTEDHDELSKKITSCALGGDALIFFDNVSSPDRRQPKFGGGPLDQALTARTWKNRVLGKMENTPELPLDATWYATGNNLDLVGDIDRRVAICKLEPDCESPELRSDFKHRELLLWAAEERPRLLAAALTILRGYAQGGFPQKEGSRFWGSFEGWSRVVKGCIEWLGLPFPMAPTSGRMVTADVEEHSALLAAWEKFDPKGLGTTAAEVLRVVEHEIRDARTSCREVDETVQGLIDALGGYPLPNPRSFGHRLRKIEGKIRNGRALKNVGDPGGVIRWAIRRPGTGELFRS